MSDNLDLSKADEIHKQEETYDLSNVKTVKADSKETTDSHAAINKDMLIGEVIEQYPELLDIFLENGLHCVGCAFSPFDTVYVGCKTHGWEDEQVDEFVQKLNDSLIKVEEITVEKQCCGGGCCHDDEPKEASCKC